MNQKWFRCIKNLYNRPLSKIAMTSQRKSFKITTLIKNNKVEIQEVL